MECMNYAKVLSVINSVIASSFLSEEKRGMLTNHLNRILKRINDKKIYLGIVGEFSAGKSTLINALIDENFFVTNVIQGTTTTITKLEYGRKVNLKIELCSGKVLRYDCNKMEILKLYEPNFFSHLAFVDKMEMWILDKFHANRADMYLLKIFDNITTSDDISHTLNEVTVYYPSNLLSNGIVIVDTPGIDSLTPSHAQITHRALKEICDIALVIIPATQPLSKTLVDYMDDNMGDITDKCIFLITKIELIRRTIERQHLRKGIIQRVANYLNVDNPHVVFAPSLLYLEDVGVIERTGRTDHLSENERHELCAIFKSEINDILNRIHNEREQTIKDKIHRLMISLQDEIRFDISDKEKELKEELDKTRILKVKPLRKFMDDFYSTHETYQYSYIESVISNTISKKKSVFMDFVFGEIDRCTTKDETQATMESCSVVSKGDGLFNDCYASFNSILSEMHASCTENFNEFKELFTNTYLIDAVNFSFSILNNPNWQREYNFRYDKTELTTFKLFRMFMSLSSIKEQMKKDVGPKINKEFAKMEKFYLSHSRKSYKDITKQLWRAKRLFIKKYEKIIAKRIRESEKLEKHLKGQIKTLKRNLESINASLL